MKKNILILGAGFSGLAAARSLGSETEGEASPDVTIIDRNTYTTMVPSLPDLAGTRIPQHRLTEDLSALVPPGIRVLNRVVSRVDLAANSVITQEETFEYDYLLIALGSVTNFFGFDQHVDEIYKLDFLEDALRIGREFPKYLQETDEPHAVIVGGGYTGLELACNLRYCATKHGHNCRVSIVELQDTILPGMPGEIRGYLEDRCKEREIELLTGRSVDSFDGSNARLSDDTEIRNVFLCWSTGTKFGLEIEGNQERAKDGRLVVDEFLRIPQHPAVYAAGDAAAMDFGDGYLRKAVNFSIGSGAHAGKNIARELQGMKPKPFSPTDLGWVIPFCNSGAGKLFSKITIKGRLPLMLHYLMCGYRNYNWANLLYYGRTALRSLFVKC